MRDGSTPSWFNGDRNVERAVDPTQFWFWWFGWVAMYPDAPLEATDDEKWRRSEHCQPGDGGNEGRGVAGNVTSIRGCGAATR